MCSSETAGYVFAESAEQMLNEDSSQFNVINEVLEKYEFNRNVVGNEFHLIEYTEDRIVVEYESDNPMLMSQQYFTRFSIDRQKQFREVLQINYPKEYYSTNVSIYNNFYKVEKKEFMLQDFSVSKVDLDMVSYETTPMNGYDIEGYVGEAMYARAFEMPLSSTSLLIGGAGLIFYGHANVASNDDKVIRKGDVQVNINVLKDESFGMEATSYEAPYYYENSILVRPMSTEIADIVDVAVTKNAIYDFGLYQKSNGIFRVIK